MATSSAEQFAHPRLRLLDSGRIEFVEAAHGELDFRVASDKGYSSQSMTREAAEHWAAAWTRNCPGDRFFVEVRIVGVTEWETSRG